LGDEPERAKLEIAIAKRRPLAGKAAKLVTIIAVVASVYHVIVLSNVLDYLFNWNVVHITHRAVHLSFFVVLTFLLVPMRKRDLTGRFPWYDVLLAILGFSGCAYVFVLFERELLLRTATPTVLDTIFGVITIIVLLEASRRLIGWLIPSLVAFFLFYALFSNHFPGILHARGYSIERILLDMYVGDLGIWSSLLGISATMIFMFILFASFLHVSGGGEFFLDFARAVAGRFRGGPAKVAVLASALFGTLSGSCIANVASTGAITIPMMKRTGYKPEFAGAIEACSSAGGMIMPPVMGAAAFIMADWLQVSYWTICVAAFIPATLYFVSLYFMVDLEAARTGLKGLPSHALPSLRSTLARGWVFVFPVAVLIYFIAVLNWNPTKAALYSIVAMIIVSLFSRKTRVNLSKLLGGLEAGGKGMLEVAVLCGTIGIMVGVIYTTGLGVKLSSMLVDFSGGNLFALLVLTAIASYILGMGLPTTACYILLAILVAPALVEMGIPPVAAHLFVFYFGIIGNITPPVCGAVFVGASIAGAPMMKTAVQAMRIAIVAYIVPFIFAYNPALVAIGPGAKIAVALLTGVVGVALVAAGVQGHLLRRLARFERLPLIAGAILLMTPGWQTDLIGLAVAFPVVARQVYTVLSARRAVTAAPVSNPDSESPES
jgi:TRAP transporter 4TM/12TM fusion protein